MNNDLKIYETNDYDMFKKLQGNRDERSAQKIKKSIRKIGYIVSPICVNEKMEVIDGQNRLMALKDLGLPVHYYVVEGVGLEEAIQMNIGRQNWKPIDYARGYALQGNVNYQRLLQLYEKSNHLSLGIISAILRGEISNGGGDAKAVNDGKIKISEKTEKIMSNRIDEINMIYDSIIKIEGSQRMAITAIAWILGVKGVNKERIYDIISNKYTLIDPVIIPKRFLENITQIYNKGLSKEKRIYFDAMYQEEFDNKRLK